MAAHGFRLQGRWKAGIEGHALQGDLMGAMKGKISTSMSPS